MATVLIGPKCKGLTERRRRMPQRHLSPGAGKP